jgi:hypothetical protein
MAMRQGLWILFFVGGCATLSLGAAGAAAPAACAPIEGTAALLKPGQILLLGEIHGNAESPAFVGDLVCRALAEKLKVTVGLEIPREEGERIQAFLVSPGSAKDREALLAGPFWQRAYQDGRSSVAMAALLETLRGWKRAGRPIAVTLLDLTDFSSSAERDRQMAGTIQTAAQAAPKNLIVVLTGNLHSRTTRGTPWIPDYENMGFDLIRSVKDHPILALNATSTGGSSWICTGATADSCQDRKVAGKGEGTVRRVRLFPQADAAGYHGTYHIGAMTASPPAVAPAKPAEGGLPPGR